MYVVRGVCVRVCRSHREGWAPHLREHRADICRFGGTIHTWNEPELGARTQRPRQDFGFVLKFFVLKIIIDSQLVAKKCPPNPLSPKGDSYVPTARYPLQQNDAGTTPVFQIFTITHKVSTPIPRVDLRNRQHSRDTHNPLATGLPRAPLPAAPSLLGTGTGLFHRTHRRLPPVSSR